MITTIQKRWFTVARFEDGFSTDAENRFRTLASYGLTPQWATEAPSKTNPLAKRALLIQLPKIESDKYRAALDKATKGEAEPEPNEQEANYDLHASDGLD